MNQSVSIAATLTDVHRKNLAIKVLAKNESITHLAAKEKVSRQFLYRQKKKVTKAIDCAFSSIDKKDDVLFYLPVTKRQVKAVNSLFNSNLS